MDIYPILIAPDPILKQVAEPVSAVNSDIVHVLEKMLRTMYDANGVGLAAPQVAIGQRIVVVDPARENETPRPLYLINPEIVARADTLRVYNEGCLSLPEFYAEIERPDWVVVRYVDETGSQKEMRAEGFLATVVQHEFDHLEGILLLDHVSKLRRDTALRRLRKLKADVSEKL